MDHAWIEVEDGGLNVSSVLAGIVLSAQPAAPDDEDPKFNCMMEMAIAQSIEDSRFDAHLCNLDERELQLGLEQSVTFAEALAMNRDWQRLVWRERERLRQKRLREEEEAAGCPTGTRR